MVVCGSSSDERHKGLKFFTDVVDKETSRDRNIPPSPRPPMSLRGCQKGHAVLISPQGMGWGARVETRRTTHRLAVQHVPQTYAASLTTPSQQTYAPGENGIACRALPKGHLLALPPPLQS